MSYLMDRLLADQQRLRGEAMPLHCPPCNQRCEQGRYCPADSCAEEGGEHHEPSATHRPRPVIGMTLVLLGWPLVAVIGAALMAVFLPH